MTLVDQRDFAVDVAELELGVGQDDAALLRVVAAELVDGDGEVAQLVGDAADDGAEVLEVNVLVVAGSRPWWRA